MNASEHTGLTASTATNILRKDTVPLHAHQAACQCRSPISLVQNPATTSQRNPGLHCDTLAGVHGSPSFLQRTAGWPQCGSASVIRWQIDQRPTATGQVSPCLHCDILLDMQRSPMLRHLIGVDGSGQSPPRPAADVDAWQHSNRPARAKPAAHDFMGETCSGQAQARKEMYSSLVLHIQQPAPHSQLATQQQTSRYFNNKAVAHGYM